MGVLSLTLVERMGCGLLLWSSASPHKLAFTVMLGLRSNREETLWIYLLPSARVLTPSVNEKQWRARHCKRNYRYKGI